MEPSFQFAPMKRSVSESSLQSWAAVSEVSWVDIESKASEHGWQEVLDDQISALMEAEPASTLYKADITELKTLHSPPSAVKLTMEVICILLQVPPKKLKDGGMDYWQPAKALMSDVFFLDKVLALRDYVPASALEDAAPYMSREDFTPDSVAQTSTAAKGLCTWAREVYKYHMLGQASAAAARQQAAGKSAEALVAESQEAIRGISKGALTELKSLGKPPREAAVVCSCLMTLFAGIDASIEVTKKGNAKDLSWGSCQKFMSNPLALWKQMETFKDKIDSGTVPRRNICNARRIQISMGGAFSPQVMGSKSAAAANLCKWLTATIAYYDTTMSNRLVCSTAAAQTIEAVSVAFPQDDKELQASATTSLQKGVSKADIVELKAMHKPPQGVMLVCMCVCILRPLGTEDESAGWAGVKAMLSDVRFIQALLDYEKDKVTENQIEKIQDLFMKNKDVFEDDNMKKVSKAAFGLLQWVRAIMEHCSAPCVEA